MSTLLSYDTAQQLLRITILDFNDVRDSLSNQTYSDLLASSFAVSGIASGKPPSEAAAKAILNRAKRAAKAAGIFGDPRIPGKQILGVLRAAATAKRSRR